MPENWSVRITRSVIGAIVSIMLASCYVKYPQTILEPENGMFPGILVGPATANEKPRKVVWIHGMCYHDKTWVVERVKLLEQTLGTTLTPLNPDPDIFNNSERKTQVWHYKASIGDNVLEFGFIVWSDLTLAAKGKLCFDVGDDADAIAACTAAGKAPEFPLERAWLNETLKSRIMNTCLSDAIVYSGRAKVNIRNAVAEAICKAISNNQGENKNCEEDPYNWADDGGPIFLVSESLGSKLLFDAMCEVTHKGKHNKAVARMLVNDPTGTQGQFFMLANQIPILDLTDYDGATKPEESDSCGAGVMLANATTLDRVLAALYPNPKVLQNLEITVVAFTDPNDILSYRIPSGYFNRPIKIVNVMSSNSGTFLGLFEWPDKAHTNYIKNKNVIRALFCGSKPRATCPVMSDKNQP